MTSTPGRSPAGFRGYTSEQKTLRNKLDLIIKWGRDLKSNVMKQSCKVLQANNSNTRETIDQIHDDLDDYKRKLDRELGLIHDICDALTINNQLNGDEENRNDEILEALRRSPTYTSLEQHIFDDKRPRIRVKPRERIHPGQNQIPRAPFLSMNTIKRKASQPIKLHVIDTTSVPGAKRRPPVDAFKRSRSFTNVEHTETLLGMDYIEEDEDDLAWKPFGPKKSVSQISFSSIHNEQSNDEQPATESSITTSTSPTEKSRPPPPPPPPGNDDSSDEEFDVAWERRAKQKARKEAASAPPPPIESPPKRNIRIPPSYHDPVEVIELDLDETTEDGFQQSTQNVNNDENESTTRPSTQQQPESDTQQTINQSQITTTSTAISSSQQRTTNDDDSQVIDDSDDEIIALSDDDTPGPSNSSQKKVVWTASEIQITSGGSQSQSLHNPYRIGIADPSIRSIFLPPPNSQSMSTSSGGSRRSQGPNRKISPTKRTTGAK